MSTLTVAMIVKNEEQFIEEVIKNVQSIADDIVITDTGSMDKTIEIIKKFKTRLFHYKWNGNEAATRNFTISKCKTDWILFVDADEFIDIGDYDKIRQLISCKNKYIAYRILLKHYFNPRISLKNLYRQDWKGSYVLYAITRIFKNREGIFYSRPIYTSVEDSLRDRQDKLHNSSIIFHHFDILRKREKKMEKAEWYCKDVFQNYRRFPSDPEVNYVVAHYYMLSGNFDKAIKYYEKALKLKPDYMKAKLSLGLCYVMLGKEEKGIKVIKACREDPNVYTWEIESYLNTGYNIIATRMLNDKLIS